MANSSKYINAQLHRTLTKLGGNMQLDMIITVDGSRNAYVRQAHLRPISSLVNYAPIADERIMDRPHHMNIKRFYEKTRGQFYEQIIDPKLASDWPMMISHAEMSNLKYIKTFDDTYHAGCQRMSHKLYGCTHEILVPVWLDWARGIRFNIYINNVGGDDKGAKHYILDISPEYLYGKLDGKYRLKQSETFHNDFVKYVLDYFDYAKISSGCTDVMNVDFQQNYSTIRGLQVETGNINIRQNFNIARNLIYRERPLLEANSLLTNSLQDYKMIVTQLINFNICFNIYDLLRATHIDIDANLRSAARYKVWVTTEALHAKKDTNLDYHTDPDWLNPDTYVWGERNTGNWEDSKTMYLLDFYTNHTYIPREKIEPNSSSIGENKYYDDNPKNYRLNALDYLQDYDCTDMMHQNKMVQPICHWLYADNPTSEQLFNVYDGFGGYNSNGDSYSHGFGSTTDLGDEEFDDGLDNALWAKKRLIGTGQAVAMRLNQPKEFLAAGDFISASEFSNGIKFNYDPATVDYPKTGFRRAPRAIYLGEMTTPPDTHLGNVWSKQVTPINQEGFIGILVDRVSYGVKSNTLPKAQNRQLELDSNDNRSDIPTRDIELDWHMYSDIDNRYAFHNKRGQCAWFDPSGKYFKKNAYIWLDANVDRSSAIVKADVRGGVVDGYSGDITPNMLVRIGGTGVYDISGRKHDNSNALYVCFSRTELEPRNESTNVEHVVPDAPLFCMFFSGWSKANATSENLVWRDLKPALSLGAIIKALKAYFEKYEPIMGMIKHIAEQEPGQVPNPDTMPLPDFDDLKLIVDVFMNLTAPEIIFFNNTVVQRQDITVSARAKEFNYYKIDGANSWVWRYSGNIKPAMYPAKTVRLKDGQLRYNMQFGRNFLYHKNPIFPLAQTFPASLGQYINKNIPPLYPSLNYDAVNPLIISNIEEWGNGNRNLTVPRGDLMYDEVPPLFRGTTNEGRIKGQQNTKTWGIEGYIETAENEGYEESQKYARTLIREGKLDPRIAGSTKIYQPEDIAYWVFKDDYNTYEWNEYKWFNQSVICAMPEEIFDSTTDSGHPEIYARSNDKATLEQAALRKICDPQKKYIPALQTIDLAYLKNIYNIEYNLISVIPATSKSIPPQVLRDERTGEVLYTYKYEIIATLK